MREGVLFARIGLSLVGHHRVVSIPPRLRGCAFGAYAFAICYSRLHETDGYVPDGAVKELGASEKVLEWLVRVGLFSRQEHDGVHGYLVVNYAEFNETKAEIEARRAKERARWTARKGNATPPGVQPESARSTPGAPPEHRRSPRGLHCSETESETDLRSPPVVPLAGDERPKAVAVAKEKTLRGTRVPPSAATDAELDAFCAKWGIDRAHERWPEFLDYWRGRGKPMLDWAAVWRNRLRTPIAAPQRGRQGVLVGGYVSEPDPEAKRRAHAERVRELEREGLQRAIEARRREASEPKKIGAA